jgi:hypothetical protein
MAFLTQNKGELCKILIITLVFEKNAIFFTENWQKSQKIVIITSTSHQSVPDAGSMPERATLTARPGIPATASGIWNLFLMKEAEI